MFSRLEFGLMLLSLCHCTGEACYGDHTDSG